MKWIDERGYKKFKTVRIPFYFFIFFVSQFSDLCVYSVIGFSWTGDQEETPLD